VLSKYLHQISTAWSNATHWHTVLIAPLTVGLASITITASVLSLRHFGGLQQLELVAYDQMVRFAPDAGPDPRLLVVAITEADIRSQKRWPLTDQAIAELLQKLQQYQPTAIGIDIYRDIPYEPGHQQLIKQFKAPNVIGITKIGDGEDLGVSPPPTLPEEQVGFNDITSDSDGVIRRNLLFADLGDATLYSFSLRLALAYLAKQGIQPKPSSIDPNLMQLNGTTLIPLDQSSGGYQKVDSLGYQILLQYRSTRIARRITLSDVLNGQVKPEWVRNKIVLFGATAQSAKDIFLTPYSRSDRENPLMPGVEIHAQSVSQILSSSLDGQKLFWYWDEWAEVVWIAAWSLIGGILAWGMRHPVLLGTAGTLSLLILITSCFNIFTRQGWIPVAAPALTLVLTGGVVVAYRAYQAQRQQQIVMTLLGQNTSPEIADALWNSRDRLIKSGKLPGQRLVATMLFTDIRNFSTISEEMPPESLLDWLNEYLDAITQEVKLHQGIINKFTGDGLLAVFGVPVTRTSLAEIAQDAQHAVACALAMGDRLQELNQNWKQRNLPIVGMRVGIFTGAVVVGSLGGKDRLEYGVIGDSVNIAARLEGYAKERQTENCRILIAQDTLVHIGQEFEVEPWGPVALKGKRQMVEVYQVVGRKPNISASNNPVSETTS
jgi:adenylate cyclase